MTAHGNFYRNYTKGTVAIFNYVPKCKLACEIGSKEPQVRP